MILLSAIIISIAIILAAGIIHQGLLKVAASNPDYRPQKKEVNREKKQAASKSFVDTRTRREFKDIKH